MNFQTKFHETISRPNAHKVIARHATRISFGWESYFAYCRLAGLIGVGWPTMIPCAIRCFHLDRLKFRAIWSDLCMLRSGIHANVCRTCAHEYSSHLSTTLAQSGPTNHPNLRCVAFGQTKSNAHVASAQEKLPTVIDCYITAWLQ